MFDKNDLEKIKEVTKEFFKKMTFEVEIEFLPQEESRPLSDGEEKEISTLCINLKTKEPQILIGERGQTLLEIQQLLKVILKRTLRQAQGKKSNEEPFFIDFDIEGYKKKKIEYLKEMVMSVADEVALTKKEKWLPSMPAYERRIIHLELAERGDVTTESVGEEPERKIVVKPHP